MRPSRVFLVVVLLACCAAGVPVSAQGSGGRYEISSSGLRLLTSGGGTTIKVLVEQSMLGGAEVDIGEITLPPGTSTPGHRHGSLELFYVLSGELEHVVNGRRAMLTPGTMGIVRPGDEVVHRVPGDRPCVALVIWVPGGEADRLGFESRALPSSR